MIRVGTAGLLGLAFLGLNTLKAHGLDAAEIEFTHGVRMTNSTAREIGRAASLKGIALSVHCPYYINLFSEKKHVIGASKQRILESMEKAFHLGAKHAVFHAGYIGTRTEEECYVMLKSALLDIMDSAKERALENVVPSPETAGKKSQFGDLQDLLKLARETKCKPTIDFAHILARTGSIDYHEVIGALSKLGHVHCHFSGIQYGDKGEKRHIDFFAKDFMPLASAMLKSKLDFTVICESPDTLGGALEIKKALNLSAETKKFK